MKIATPSQELRVDMCRVLRIVSQLFSHDRIMKKKASTQTTLETWNGLL